ncbi:MAG: hypothetical protein P8Y70_01030 [Candidatus Lokiarchaeota archaeon]
MSDEDKGPYDILKSQSRTYWYCFLVFIVIFAILAIVLFVNYYVNIAP